MGEYVYILEVTLTDKISLAELTYNAGYAFKTKDLAESKKKEMEAEHLDVGQGYVVHILALPLIG